MGIVALCTLTMHGGHYLAMKTQGPVRDRARALAAYAFLCTLGGSLAAMAATSFIHPELWENFTEHPVSLAIPLGAAAGLIGGGIAARKGRDAGAFLGSTIFILGMLVATAFGLFPRLLPSSTDPALALTAYNSAAYGEGMRAALPWWGCGMALASLYTIFMYRSFRGKVAPGDDDHGY
jgi:cytochrome d ubiquinol oxidase subunit II